MPGRSQPTLEVLAGSRPGRSAAGRPVLVSRGPRGQLTRGQRLPPEAVAADQRQRLLTAVVSVVAAHGRAGTRMHDVLYRAGVSQTAIYEHFAGVDDLLLCACEGWLTDLLNDLERALAGGGAWTENARPGLRRLLENVAAAPEHARCCFVELCAIGPPGQECRAWALERLGVLLRPRSNTGRDGGGLSVADELLAGGVWHAIESAVLADATASVTSLLPALETVTELRFRDSFRDAAVARPARQRLLSGSRGAWSRTVRA